MKFQYAIFYDSQSDRYVYYLAGSSLGVMACIKAYGPPVEYTSRYGEYLPPKWNGKPLVQAELALGDVFQGEWGGEYGLS